MALQKGFLHTKIHKHQIAKWRYVLGILIGLSVAFSLYALQYLLREVFRVLSISETHHMLVLSDAEVSFYNLIFAFIAVILGQSFCLIYWFDRPRKRFKMSPGRLRTIVNDQRFLNWTFLNWFSRIIMLYGVLVITPGLGMFYHMSFYPDFNYVFILCIIAMFLQTWTSLLLTFKRGTYKWMLLSILLISLVSYGFSKIDIVDFKEFNTKVEEQSMRKKHDLEELRTEYFDVIGNHFTTRQIHLVMEKGMPVIFLDNKRITPANLMAETLKNRGGFNELGTTRVVFQLYFEEQMEMTYVEELKQTLVDGGVWILYFVIKPENTVFGNGYYEDVERTVFSIVNQKESTAPRWVPSMNDVAPIENKIHLYLGQNKISIGNTLTTFDRLQEQLGTRMKQNLDFVVLLHYDGNTGFRTYFKALNAIRGAIYDLRSVDSFKAFGLKYNELLRVYDNYEVYGTKREEYRKWDKEIQAKIKFRFYEIYQE